MATVVTMSIQSRFLFHMGAAQICSALSHIRHTWEWKEKTTVATFEIIWAKLYKSIRLAKERPQKGRVTVGLSTDQIQCQNHQSGLRLRVVPHFSSGIVERASETRACLKITPREERRHTVGREKNEGLQTEPKLLILHGQLTLECEVRIPFQVN